MKFVLSPDDPYEYNIMFVDNDCYAQIKTVMLNIISSWRGLNEQTAPETPRTELFRSFSEMPMTMELNNMLQNLCYWEAGKYELEICIKTKPDPIMAKKHFLLTEEHINQLKINSSNIIANACNQPAASYSMATVELS